MVSHATWYPALHGIPRGMVFHGIVLSRAVWSSAPECTGDVCGQCSAVPAGCTVHICVRSCVVVLRLRRVCFAVASGCFAVASGCSALASGLFCVSLRFPSSGACVSSPKLNRTAGGRTTRRGPTCRATHTPCSFSTFEYPPPTSCAVRARTHTDAHARTRRSSTRRQASTHAHNALHAMQAGNRLSPAGSHLQRGLGRVCPVHRQ